MRIYRAACGCWFFDWGRIWLHLWHSGQCRCQACGAACEEYIIEARRLRKDLAEMHTIVCEKDTEISRLSAANFELQAQVNRLRERVEWFESGYVHTCHAECQKPLCVANREVDRLRADRDGWMQLAGMHEMEVERLGQLVAQWQKTWDEFTPMNAAKNARLSQLEHALRAIAAKGEASPGDKKAQMAKDAIEGKKEKRKP